MSERLTTRLANGGVGYDNGEYFKVCYPWNEHCLTDIDRMAIKLCELEDKIEQGKILELPCKIGDEKFAILPNTNVIVKGKVCTLIYQNGFLVDFGYNPDKRFGGYNAYTQLLPEELFDTYEEAEAKLREMEGADNEQR
jgi:hypothetical protein